MPTTSRIMLALDIQLTGPAIQLSAAALGALALDAGAEPGALAAPGSRKVRRSKISNACSACRRTKVKCEEEKPCARCISHGWRDSCVSWRKVKASRSQGPGADRAGTLLHSGAVQSLVGLPHGLALGGMFATPKMSPAPTSAMLSTSVVACSGAASRDEWPRTLATNVGAGDDGAEGKVGRKRSNITDACSACRRSKVKCEEERPCARCISHGWRDSCVSWHKVKASRSKGPCADRAGTLLATPTMPPAPNFATLSTSGVARAASRGELPRTSTDTDPESDSCDKQLSTNTSEADTDLSEYGDDGFWKSVEHLKAIPIAFD